MLKIWSDWFNPLSGFPQPVLVFEEPTDPLDCATTRIPILGHLKPRIQFGLSPNQIKANFKLRRSLALRDLHDRESGDLAVVRPARAATCGRRPAGVDGRVGRISHAEPAKVPLEARFGSSA